MMKINIAQTRTQVSAIKKIVDGDLKTKIDKYKNVSEKLSKSKSDFNTAFCDALNTEAEVLENTRMVYSAILSYLSNVTSGLEQKDATLIKN